MIKGGRHITIRVRGYPVDVVYRVRSGTSQDLAIYLTKDGSSNLLWPPLTTVEKGGIEIACYHDFRERRAAWNGIDAVFGRRFGPICARIPD